MIGLMRAAAALLLTYCAVTSASVEGLWWDPSVVGEGWTFESQNDLAAVTWYRYEEGRPAFRTAVGETSFHTVTVGGVEQPEIRMAGRVHRTDNFTNSVDVGPFNATFRVVDGGLRGTVTAEGVTRTIVPFTYNYAQRVDQYRGGWVITNFEAPGVPEGAAFAFFDVPTYIADDGTPYRWMVLDDGREGYVYYDEEIDQAVAIVFNADDSYFLGVFSAGDESALGYGALYNSNDQQTSESFWITAMAVANSDNEREVLAELLGYDLGRKAGRAGVHLNRANLVVRALHRPVRTIRTAASER